MKKLGILILCLVLACSFVLAGCGQTATESPSGSASAPSSESQSAASESQSDSQSASESSSQVASGEYDPQTDPDTIKIEDLEKEFGALPEVPEGFTIGSVTNEPANEYWALVGQGIEARCKELGITLDQQFAIGTEDQSGQLAAMETLAGKGYDAYIVSPLTVDNLQGKVDELMADGKVVINPYLEVLQNADVFIGSLDSICAEMAAKHAIEVLGGEGEVALCLGAVASKLVQIRCGHFKEYIEANSNIKVTEEMAAEWEADTAMQMTMDMMTTNPNIKLIWCANDNMAMGVVEGLRAKNLLGEVKVMAMDGTSVGLQAVKNGEMEATYANNPFLIGQMSVDLALRKACGQDINRTVEMPITEITKDTVDAYMAETGVK